MSRSRIVLLTILVGPFVAATLVFLAVKATESPRLPAASVEVVVPDPGFDPGPATQDRGPTSPASHLSGPLGHGAAAETLVRSFLQQATGHEAFLDLKIAIDDFQGSVDDGFLVIWDSCDGLPLGEPPGPQYCTGWSLRFADGASSPAEPVLQRLDDGVRLRGRFRLGACDGPHQGMMGCLLVPVAALTP